MEQNIPFLYDIEPDDYEPYAQMIMRDLDEFVLEHIQNERDMKKRQKNLAWLLNWIGKDCYQHLSNPKYSSKKKECLERKEFIKDKYANKKETKPFLSLEESSNYLLNNLRNPDGAFVSRLSSRVPGELTIQHYNEEDGGQKAQRFDYKTQKNAKGESIDDYLKTLIEKKNEYIKKNNLQKERRLYDKSKVENYYSPTGSPKGQRKSPRQQKEEEEEEISFKPYSEEPIEEKKSGIYLQPGEFTKRANRFF
jgi:hypothetical protein